MVEVLSEKYFRQVKFHMKYTGISFWETSKYYSYYKVFVHFFFGVWVLGLMAHLVNSIITFEVTKSKVNFCYFSFYTAGFSRYFAISIYKKNVLELVETIESRIGELKDIEKLAATRASIKSNRALFKFFNILGHMSVLLWLVYPVIVSKGDYDLISETTPFLVPKFMQSESIIVFMIQYTIIVGIFYNTSRMGCYTGLLVITLIESLILQLRVITIDLKNMKGRKIIYKELVKIVIEHNKVMDLLGYIRHILLYPLLVLLIMTCSIICVTGFEIIVGGNLFNIRVLALTVIASYSLLELLIGCHRAEGLASEIVVLGDSVYDLDWYEEIEDQQQRRNITYAIQMIILQNQHPTEFSAGGFISLSYRCFTKVCRMAYSFLTLLNQYKKKY